MYNVRLLPIAKLHVKEAAASYNEQLPGLGKRFRDNVRKKVLVISINPHGYSIRYNNMRTATIDVFPYIIYFFVDEVKRTVFISAIPHSSRKPRNW